MKTVGSTQRLSIGIIGAGYMGRSHSHAYRNLVGHPLCPYLYAIATSREESARHAAEQFGFAHYTDNWQEICTDKNVDVVCVTTPVHLHFEAVKLALAHNKHVSVEKPIVLNQDRLHELNALIADSDVKINVGYNYLHNPVIYYAKQLLDDGVIGDIVSFRVVHSEDFMARQHADCKPWHIKQEIGGGVMRDVGSHPLALINYLLEPVSSVIAKSKRQYQTRNNQQVTLEDHVDLLLQMPNNVQGSLTVSWINSGRGMFFAWEVFGTEGALCFNQERLNEIDVYKVEADKLAFKGGLTVRASSHHPGFSVVCPGDEHGVGFLDLKILETKSYLESIHNNSAHCSDWNLGYTVEMQLDAIYQSAEVNQWIDVRY